MQFLERTVAFFKPGLPLSRQEWRVNATSESCPIAFQNVIESSLERCPSVWGSSSSLSGNVTTSRAAGNGHSPPPLASIAAPPPFRWLRT